MKKGKKDELRKEYIRSDFGTGIKGKYYHDYVKGANLVLIHPDIIEAFPTEESVNNALRGLIQLAKKTIRVKKTRKKHKIT